MTYIWKNFEYPISKLIEQENLFKIAKILHFFL
jgi:hypothetical protein